ncbi:ImmA/IrrE family metallo-endopeptidase [Pedobacter frigiditerrae]|uniref:ImmA/IrrE family metallo-endopeptidase n=1 Tax=Pedobacter frigiditerrae TaxID=2530452 RepID=A0A4R0N2Z2_9SPHI|nr:ImmA/IrrE family metallo-endopeptidase [Pedobacter frigiditerrae]TCC93693.1 ImmA/IrrE family metallo-endopeptidase [Pedobacter frigiditerrae]
MSFYKANIGYYNKLSETVNELLANAGVMKAPVPIKQIAAMCGANVVGYDFGGEISGVLVVEENKYTIGFNTENSRVRQRFTIAHELGHLKQHVNLNNKNEFFVDRDFIVKFRSDIKYSPKEIAQERQANAFAAAILMPKEFILHEMKDPKYKELHETNIIEELAKVFEVSVPAMTYRLSDLNIYRY